MLLAILFACTAFAARFQRGFPRRWERTDDVVNPNQILSVRFALHQNQSGLKTLADETIDRATPSSLKYGQWYTNQQVLDLVAPPQAHTDAVLAWCTAQVGFKCDGSRRDVVIAVATVAAIERAMQAKLSVFKHLHVAGESKLGTLEWSLPDRVNQYVAVVAGLSEFWTKPRVHSKPVAAASGTDRKRNDILMGYNIPQTVRKLYNMPSNAAARKMSLNSSIAVVEFMDYGSYAHADLTYFDQQCAEERSHVNHIVGPFAGNNPQLESELDIQWASTLSLNATTYYWTATGWMMEFSNDLFTNPGPLVVSMSWGWYEAGQCMVSMNCSGITSQQYIDRVDAEWLKITATGVSLLAASGDQGAPGDEHYSDCGGVSDIYPGASPWITSVGATMYADSFSFPTSSGPPACANNWPPGCATSQNEIVCSLWDSIYGLAIITSGGGFASYEPMPKWQTAAVNAYLKSGAQIPPAGSFNPANRAFPDLSAMGHAVLIAYEGALIQVDGTSCSTPIVASMVTLLNGWRINNNKKTLGFLNPMIYAAAAASTPPFRDITSGSNFCSEYCCSFEYGYEAAVGWDGSTGVGTPLFDKWLAYVQTLP